MTRQELRSKIDSLEKWERRFFWLIIAAFIIPVAAFLSLRHNLDAVPHLQAALGLISFSAFFFVIIALLLIHPRRVKSLGLECPGCRAPLCGINSMFVMSTTRCGCCGHEVIHDNGA
jgi:hypothetical protein